MDVVPATMKTEARAVERVKVFCRVRPLLQRERDGWSYEEYCQHFGEDGERLDANDTQQPATEATPEGSDDDPATFITEKGRRSTGSLTPSVTMQSDGRSVTFQAPTAAHGEARLFQFDGNLNETCDQQTVYERVAAPIVEDVMAGYNGTILAYGQTATGKTHTMVGPGDLVHGDQRGVIPRALEDIFNLAEKTRSHAKTTVALSYVQIYCERIFDLLEPETLPSNILVREDADRGVYIDGAAAVYVSNIEDCLSLMDRGNANRAVSSTEMNAHSSRSHAILILRVERKEFAPPASSDAPRSMTQPVIRLSNLYLVDLAGSERVKKARVYGRHISELKAINLSLSALGNCISALSKQSQQNQTSYHVPYRDSKLTRLLQSSLGGNAKTALVVTVTPAVTEAPETLQTLQFGQRAMQVAVRAHRSALSVLDYRTLYEEMRQALDEEQQRSQQAESTASDEKNRAAVAEDKLTKALLRVQHLEFELEAAQTVARHSTTTDVEGDGVERMKLELQQLVTRHAQDVAQVKSACDRQIETYKRLAHEASQEWHEVEGELAGEKTQVLHTLQELKEFKLRYFQLEEDTMERIAELVQDERDREKERDAALSSVAIMEKELKAIHAKMVEFESQREKLQDQIDTEFVPKEAIQQMEALYEGAISKLQARVGCLESKSLNRRPKTPSNNSNNNSAPQRSLPEVRKLGMANRAVPKVGRLVPGARSSSSSRLSSGPSVSSRIVH
ncbi:Kinesin motor domain [Phytophthora infestans]|uniref:Kinesin motor domain n=1 Tax=Phytophthora infestans TaxID=4787 RepID=A0A833WZ31_PHYIN|nr:Kinesin motor domain [Phytophthora infestans]